MNRRSYTPTEPVLMSYCDRIQAFRDGDDSPRDFLERCLERIEGFEKEIKAFTVVNIDGARQAADASTRRYKEGRPLSQVDGMPIGVKDIIHTADMPTQMGSSLFKDWRPISTLPLSARSNKPGR